MTLRLQDVCVVPAIGILLGAGMSASALAQVSGPAQPLLDDRFVLSVSAFVVQSDLKAGLNGQSDAHPDLDFNDTFGRAKDATRVRADALWRITPTQHVRFMYFDNKNRSSRALDRTVDWGDYMFQVGAKVDLETRFTIAEAAYEWAFLRGPSYEVGATVGVHYTDTRIKLSGMATLTDASGNVSQAASTVKSSSVPAPLPVIGLRGGWVVAPHWYVDALGQFFKMKVNGVDGHLSELGARATWMFSDNFGLGIGYEKYSSAYDISRRSFDGRLRWSYSGLLVSLTGAF
jgi:hypothetical protein